MYPTLGTPDFSQFMAQNIFICLLAIVCVFKKCLLSAYFVAHTMLCPGIILGRNKLLSLSHGIQNETGEQTNNISSNRL